MGHRKKLWIIALLFLIMLISIAFARDKASNNSVMVNFNNQLMKPCIGEEDTPSLIMLSWIGTGKLGVYTISNTGQNGLYEPPVDWGGYTGEFPWGYTLRNGRTGEYPRGSQQFYVWAAGLWVGAMVQKDVDTLIIKEPRVATCAYYSDQGALSDLFQTNQKIPEGQDNGGEFLFKQKGITDLEEYQQLWVYADTSINARRRAVGHPELQIDPEKGDYLSNEDTYAVWGDYFPERDASTFNYVITGYDTDPVGIRVEQRTYSWSTDAYIYLNYQITNMNDFPLEDVYFGYFMDNDVGDAADDLIGYDEDLNLGYSYDSDFTEAGWEALAGYIGTVFLKTPEDSTGKELGLTGFQTWTIDGDEADVDNEGEDDLKYYQLSKGGYEIFSVPQDVRQLTASGPVKYLQPGETVEVTIAVIAGGSLSEVRENTISALERYALGYIGPEPPPSPNLTIEPAEKRSILCWDKFPENIPDPFSGEVDFEGYRVYKSTDNGLTWGTPATDLERYPNAWEPIAEYDIPDSETGRFVLTSYTSGSSKATIDFEDFTDNADDYFIESRYAIEFYPGNILFVYNLNQQKTYFFNTNALNDGDGFAILKRSDLSAYSDASYRTNELITFDGIFVSISNDTTLDSLGVEEVSYPDIGDIFTVQTFTNQTIGEQYGLDYVYIDEKLTNGMSYSYAVTAFDRGDPTIGLPSLESSLFTNKTTVIPRGTAVDRTVENLSFVTRVSGISSGIVGTSIHNPLEMISADFTVEFFGGDTLTQQALYLRVVNSTADSVVADSIALSNGSTGLSFYGIDLTAIGPANAEIDTVQFGWKTGCSSSYTFTILSQKSQPFDYEVKFVNALDADTYTGDEVILPAGVPAPWEVRNISLDTPSSSYAMPMITGGFTESSILYVMKENYSGFDFAFGLQLDMSDTTDAIQPDDVWEIKTFKPFSNSDVFTFKTQGFNEIKSTEEYSLDDVKVVPNPYYVRAQWDSDRFNKHIKFTHLPGICRIRIFTTSGILIRTIEHNENAGDPVGYHSWILRNKENLDIASGLYIYQVTDLNSGKEKIGKFAIIL